MTEKSKPSVPDPVKRTVREQGDIAFEDLSDAQKFVGSASHRNVAFLAQQCVEKSLKAVMMLHEREFPFTHDIEDILRHVAAIARGLAASCGAGVKLTAYAVKTRYGRTPAVSYEEAREAVSIADDVYAKVKAYVAEYGVNWP